MKRNSGGDSDRDLSRLSRLRPWVVTGLVAGIVVTLALRTTGPEESIGAAFSSASPSPSDSPIASQVASPSPAESPSPSSSPSGSGDWRSEDNHWYAKVPIGWKVMRADIPDAERWAVVNHEPSTTGSGQMRDGQGRLGLRVTAASTTTLKTLTNTICQPSPQSELTVLSCSTVQIGGYPWVKAVYRDPILVGKVIVVATVAFDKVYTATASAPDGPSQAALLRELEDIIETFRLA